MGWYYICTHRSIQYHNYGLAGNFNLRPGIVKELRNSLDMRNAFLLCIARLVCRVGIRRDLLTVHVLVIFPCCLLDRSYCLWWQQACSTSRLPQGSVFTDDPVLVRTELASLYIM